jgi:type II secretory pathway pseudopilin PulG
MQSMIVIAIMSIFMVFMAGELSRNDNSNNLSEFRADNITANILQYQTAITQYILVNYDKLHLAVTSNAGNVEQVKPIDYKQIGKYSQKNLLPLLNYQSISFNYSKAVVGENQMIPVLYLATSWDGYATTQISSSYANTRQIEVMGKLGEILSKPLYQGDSSYWTIPWIFSQSNCQINELYSQLPNAPDGSDRFTKLKNIFNLWCSQIEANSNYRFMTYVYLAPIFSSDV